MIINGAVGGARTFLWSVVLICLPLYMVALVMADSLKEHAEAGHGAQEFSTLSRSFFTVFRCIIAQDCTSEDGTPIFVAVSEHYWWGYGVIYCTVSLLITFGLFNIIVAIFVENIVAAARFNDTHLKRQRLMDTRMFTDRVSQLVEFVCTMHKCRFSSEHSHTDGESGPMEVTRLEITPEFFHELRGTHQFQEILRDLDVADEDQLDLFDTLDVNGNGIIDLEELVIGIAKLRGDARRSDIVAVGLMVRSMQMSLTSLEDSVIQRLQDFQDHMMSGGDMRIPVEGKRDGDACCGCKERPAGGGSQLVASRAVVAKT
eukprot:CAMPEP_0197932720 /NCGR_PEP_ID=MMETSP1439-20131203/109036_1 /TAXON_ID=66791 /ORGANISM="Gonyaulax spinifera, Strain CCMP409" /LENGTH=315 /DNA_ID=CAMNT_0043555519 /DNA_START=101 /DNA_END=1045 /DNA_ORIENTATION=-